VIIELQRFVELGPGWWKDPGNHTREAMVFEPITINTEYVATLRRFPVAGGIELCSVWMVDRGNNFTVDITYEQMRDILKGRKPPPAVKIDHSLR
jgi:hypothetical protein